MQCKGAKVFNKNASFIWKTIAFSQKTLPTSKLSRMAFRWRADSGPFLLVGLFSNYCMYSAEIHIVFYIT